MKRITGQLAPSSDIAQCFVRIHLIDQHAQTFDPEHSIEQVLRNELGTVEEGRFRQVFANAGLDARLSIRSYDNNSRHFSAPAWHTNPAPPA
ncbi:hypothetical protein [Pseudomonas sp. nanlin1]|uniref:hypothetical protein n=1 Tax=Pseudomonas sp. nanlin1 TaxID=3040605 RepID=UPI00388E5E17